MCRKQTFVSHSSTESEVISLDAGLGMDGLLALDLWDLLIEVLRSTNNNVQPKYTRHQGTGTVLVTETDQAPGNRMRSISKMDVDTHLGDKEVSTNAFSNGEANS